MGVLDGKIAIVTGGTRGIGLCTCEKLANEGAIVFACARNAKEFHNDHIIFHKLDISDRNSVKELYNDVVNRFGYIDILINNAGIMKDRTTKNMSYEEFDDVIDTNVKGTFNMVKLFGPEMQKRGSGSIINITSFVSKNGNIGQANYVASKAAIEGMSKCWAKEFTTHGENVRVNCVSPGVVLTDIFNNTPIDIVDGFKGKTAFKRLATVDDIANVILFLCKEESSYITGTTIDVDGNIQL